MQYRVPELAAAAGTSVDTVRFYQAQRLLPPPRRVGRHAVYDGRHLARLRRVRQLQREGYPLAVIRRLLDPGAGRTDAALRRALATEQGTRVLSRGELAAEAGVPEALITAVENVGIVDPVRVAARAQYGDPDVEMAP